MQIGQNVGQSLEQKCHFFLGQTNSDFFRFVLEEKKSCKLFLIDMTVRTPSYKIKKITHPGNTGSCKYSVLVEAV